MSPAHWRNIHWQRHLRRLFTARRRALRQSKQWTRVNGHNVAPFAPNVAEIVQCLHCRQRYAQICALHGALEHANSRFDGNCAKRRGGSGRSQRIPIARRDVIGIVGAVAIVGCIPRSGINQRYRWRRLNCAVSDALNNAAIYGKFRSDGPQRWRIRLCQARRDRRFHFSCGDTLADRYAGAFRPPRTGIRNAVTPPIALGHGVSGCRGALNGGCPWLAPYCLVCALTGNARLTRFLHGSSVPPRGEIVC